ncbi:MAG TPA: hypothetical protein PKZ61_16385 [Thermoflexales bacterium]|nr:hypothetical protein [Thermoflexales bacterium]
MKPTNSVRACFLASSRLTLSRALEAVKWLEPHGWRSTGSKTENSVDLICNVRGQYVDARLLWLLPDDFSAAHFSLDVADGVFFPGTNTAFRSTDNPLFFGAYVSALSELIRFFTPIIGVIDYETDWTFNGYGGGGDVPFFAWGMFLSRSLMHAKPNIGWSEIISISAKHYEYEQGSLVFCDPMDPYRPWTERQLAIQELLKPIGMQRRVVDIDLWRRLTEVG